MAARDSKALACALVAHALVVWSASRFPRVPTELPSAHVPTHAPEDVVDLDIIDLDLRAAPMHPVARPTQEGSAASSRAPVQGSRAPRTERRVAVAPAAPTNANGTDSADPPSEEGAPGATDEGWTPLDEPGSGARTTLTGARGLDWDDRLDLAARPAPTSTKKRDPITSEKVTETLRSVVRDRDAKLGLDDPESHAVAVAVQVAGRQAGVPSKTRARFEVDLDKDGNLLGARVASASAGNELIWADVLAKVRAALEAGPVPLGPDAKRAGTTVVVDATVLHVFASGTEDYVVLGECPKMPTVGGEAQPGFGNIGGTLFGEHGRGTCPMADAGNPLLKTIVVRTQTRSIFAGQAPPPVETFGPARQRPKRFNLWDLVLGE